MWRALWRLWWVGSTGIRRRGCIYGFGFGRYLFVIRTRLWLQNPRLHAAAAAAAMLRLGRKPLRVVKDERQEGQATLFAVHSLQRDLDPINQRRTKAAAGVRLLAESLAGVAVPDFG